MKALNLEPYKLENGLLQSFAWPGGYPMLYLCEDNGVLCPDCVNANLELVAQAEQDKDTQWNVVAYDVNWEDESMYCDNCSKRIPSAYGDDE